MKCHPLRFLMFLLISATSVCEAAPASFGQIGTAPVGAAEADAATLEAQFRTPPKAARPWVYWFIMNGNLSRAGITADLEAMQAAGLGGCVLMEVNVGIPQGPVEFMSDRWCRLFKHAVEEAERLGLEIDLNAGPGWTGSGGPWVKPEESMQHLVASVVTVTGPATYDAVLPRPLPRKPYFGTAGLPAELIKAQEDFYADVALLAVPGADDGPRLKDVDEKALYVREPYTSKPGVKAYLSPPGAQNAASPMRAIAVETIVDLSDRLQEDGRLAWKVPPGEWTLLRFGRTSTGANTRPAPRSGLGLECDKFSTTALDAHFDQFVGRLVRTVGPRPADRTSGWTMLHIDSWEMGSQNWTAGFRQQFQRRRGYDPLPYLPAMTGRVVGSEELSERFLWDLRLTAQELVIDHHARHLKQLGRRHGFRLSIEPYDMNPTSDMTLGGVADVPMCEFWADGYGFDATFSCIEATSIAHTLGRRIVAAEAFTSGADEAWKLFPAALKNQTDWALATGINRLVFHRFAHQPWLDRRPGMTMGPYGVHWDRTQTWWPMVTAYHRYLARCQWLLRQGTPVADICYLVPEGAPHVFRPPPSALVGQLPDRRGYNFDACTPETLCDDKTTVSDNCLVVPGGGAYRLLVLPAFDRMTPALLRRIHRLVEAGVSVVGPPPRKSPSLSGYPQCDREVASLAAALWGDTARPAELTQRNVGRGKIVWGSAALVTPSDGPCPVLYPHYQATAKLLADSGLPADFEADGPVRYTHRRTDTMDIYFVANRESRALDVNCTFRVSNRQPECWDPLDGTIRDLPDYEQGDGRTVVPLHFAAHQSLFVVFRTPAAAPARHRSGQTNFVKSKPVAQIDGPWDVAFDPALGGPKSVRFETLVDWTTRPEPGIKYYSGIATYRTTFDLPDGLRGTATPKLLLDLGQVQNLAQVRLNGHDLGVVWCSPWQVDISAAVQLERNCLEIEVANLWPNRLIGDQRLPADQRVTWTTWNPYKADSPLLPSGLIGPVRLEAAAGAARRNDSLVLQPADRKSGNGKPSR
jgi:hypothetical protein